MSVTGKVVREAQEIWTDVTNAGKKIKKSLKNRQSNRETFMNSDVNPQSAYKNGKKKK